MRRSTDHHPSSAGEMPDRLIDALDKREQSRSRDEVPKPSIHRFPHGLQHSSPTIPRPSPTISMVSRCRARMPANCAGIARKQRSSRRNLPSGNAISRPESTYSINASIEFERFARISTQSRDRNSHQRSNLLDSRSPEIVLVPPRRGTIHAKPQIPPRDSRVFNRDTRIKSPTNCIPFQSN